jgi:O-antigen/teichoic acid export membrane protein
VTTNFKSSSLTRRAGVAAGFRLGGNLANVFLGLSLGVILARLLPPREFGVFGVGLGITAFAEIFGSFGVLQALVQRKSVGPEDEGTAAILQMGGALLLASGVVLTGPTIERFFAMPGLGPLVQLQSLILVINGLGLIPNSRLTRRLAFERLTIIDVMTKLAGGTISIILAFNGIGAISLTFGHITTGLFRTCLLWFFAPGGIPLSFRLSSLKNLLGYGSWMLFNALH